MNCNVKECIHNICLKCENTNLLNEPTKGTECISFDYHCEQCMELGFKYYDCCDCCLSEDEYYDEVE